LREPTSKGRLGEEEEGKREGRGRGKGKGKEKGEVRREKAREGEGPDPLPKYFGLESPLTGCGSRSLL